MVLWQDKAWVDRPLALEWAEDVIKPFIQAERKAGVAAAARRYLLFQDNLDSQKQPAYIALLNQEVDRGRPQAPPKRDRPGAAHRRTVGWAGM